MSEIGQRMFRGAAIGGGAGLVTGILKGTAEANKLTEQVPKTTVEIPAYDRPVEDRICVDNARNQKPGESSRWVSCHYKGYARNPDGSVRMEQVPAETVTGRGDGTITWRTHKMEEPFVRAEESERRTRTYTDSDGNTQTERYTDTDTHIFKRNLGTWNEPRVNFVDGINRAGIVMKNVGIFTALGIGFGALGGAIYHTAVKS